MLEAANPANAVSPRKVKRPGLAWLLSLIIPGAGQLYCGMRTRAAWCFAPFLITVIAGMFGPPRSPTWSAYLAVILVVVFLFAPLDAFYTAREMNSGKEWPPYGNPRVAATLNLTTRGFGYWYLGERTKGWFWFIASFFLQSFTQELATATKTRLALFVPNLVLIFIAWDAYRIGKRGLGPRPRSEPLTASGMTTLGLSGPVIAAADAGASPGTNPEFVPSSSPLAVEDATGPFKPAPVATPEEGSGPTPPPVAPPAVPEPPAPQGGLPAFVPLGFAGIVAFLFLSLQLIGLAMPDFHSLDQRRARLGQTSFAKVYSNSAYQVEVRIPLDWSFQDVDEPYLVAASRNDAACNIKLQLNSSLPLRSLESISSNLTSAVMDADPNYTLEGRRLTNLGTLDALDSVFDLVQDRLPVRVHMLVARQGFTVYLLSSSELPPFGNDCPRDFDFIRANISLPK